MKTLRLLHSFIADLLVCLNEMLCDFTVCFLFILLELKLNSLCTIKSQVGGLCLCNFVILKYALEMNLHSDVFEPISFQRGIMPGTIKLYSLSPV